MSFLPEEELREVLAYFYLNSSYLTSTTENAVMSIAITIINNLAIDAALGVIKEVDWDVDTRAYIQEQLRQKLIGMRAG